MLQITDKGITTESLPEILERVSNRFREIYGRDINLDPSTPDGQLIGFFAQEMANANQIISAIVHMLNPYTATGRWLTDRALYAGVVRRGADYSRANNVIVTGNKGVQLPSGLVLRDGNGNKWVTEIPYRLNQDGSAVIKVRSQELGVYQLSKNDELTTESLLVGIDKIVVDEPSIDGKEEETDGELLVRFMKSHAINNEDDRDGIQASILSLDDVKQCVVYENPTGKTDDIGVPPHSINAVVVGGRNKDIAMAIIRKKKGGCGMMGEISESVEVGGLPRVAKFDRAKDKKVSVNVTVKRVEMFTDYDEERTKQALSETQFSIGEDVYSTRLYCQIPNQKGFIVTNITVNDSDTVEVSPRELAVINKENVNVDMAV